MSSIAGCVKRRKKKTRKQHKKNTRKKKTRKKKTRKKRGGAKDDKTTDTARAYVVNTDRILKAEQDGDKLIKNYNALLKRKSNLAFLKRAKKGRFMYGKTLKRKHQEIDSELKLLENKLRSQDHKDLLTIYNKGDNIFYVKPGKDGKPILMDMETVTSESSSTPYPKCLSYACGDEYKNAHKAKRELLSARKYAAEKNLEKTRKRKAVEKYGKIMKQK